MHQTLHGHLEASDAHQVPANADGIAENEKTPENRGLVTSCQVPANTDFAGEWARDDSNTSPVSTEKTAIPNIGAVKGAVIQGDSFAQAVAAVMGLPLSDGEKAEAIRRLLAGRKATNVTEGPSD